MATSGTIGTTSFNVATLIEKAYRRCNILPGSVTPELVDIANQNLNLIFNDLSNRGVNLWCINKELLGLQTNKTLYELPVGTIDILNAVQRTPLAITATSATTAAASQSYDTEATTSIVALVGFKLDTAVASVTLAHSTDDVTYTDILAKTATFEANKWYWLEVDGSTAAQYWQLTFPTTTAVTDIVLAETFTDLTISRINRDDFNSLPDKRATGTTGLQYWLNRQITPEMNLWPAPSAETSCLYLLTHRQIEDAGTMLNTIAVPDRWLDAILWKLAAMCAVEVPEVPADRIQLSMQMARESLFNADSEERDNSPIYLRPNIGVYTA